MALRNGVFFGVSSKKWRTSAVPHPQNTRQLFNLGLTGQMAESWLTFAPVRHYWHLPDGLELPYQFSERVSYRPFPDWLFLHDPVDLLRTRVREKLGDEVCYCIAVEYQADALGSLDPDWTGVEPRSIQSATFEYIQYVNFALWLARPTGLRFELVAHAVNHNTEWLVRQMREFAPFSPLPEYQNEKLGFLAVLCG